jgi:hypothetical protein
MRVVFGLRKAVTSQEPGRHSAAFPARFSLLLIVSCRALPPQPKELGRLRSRNRRDSERRRVVPPTAIRLGVQFQRDLFQRIDETSRPVPIGRGASAFGLDTTISFSLATLLKVARIPAPGKWNFASSLIPYAKVMKMKGDAHVNTLPVHELTQTQSDAFDLFLRRSLPLSFGERELLASLVSGTYGNYDVNRAANTSLNNWTFVPTLSYTKTCRSTDSSPMRRAASLLAEQRDPISEHAVVDARRHGS